MDSGVGIKPEILSTLFSGKINPSRRGTEREPGTGLGLSICKDLITLNGGQIWVESQENSGSEFIFTLPSGQPIDQN